MSRCRACNRILTIPEMSQDTNKDGICRMCTVAALSQYDILSDKEYVGGVLDGIDSFEEFIGNCE